MSTIGLYPEYFNPGNFFFQWNGGNKMNFIYQRLSKEGNVDHKYLRCPYLWYKKFEVLRAYISLDKIDLAGAEKVGEKLMVMMQVLLTTQTQCILMGIQIYMYDFM